MKFAAVMVAVLALLGCGSPGLSSPPPMIEPAATPTATPVPPDPGSALIVTLLDDPGPHFGVRVEAIAPNGMTRQVATLLGVHPAGWGDASPAFDTPTVIGPDGHLVLVVDRDDDAGLDVTMTLLSDLRNPLAPPVEIHEPVMDPIWGPAGQLAVMDGTVVVYDPESGTRQRVIPPNGVVPRRAWTVDGSGWLASQEVDDGGPGVAGVLMRDGTFVPRPARPFAVTGMERWLGADGGSLGIAFDDGFESSQTVVTERRGDLPQPCYCRVWVRTETQGDDAVFGEPLWDAAGTGVWIPMADADGPRRWLSHVTTPEVDAPVADLPDGGDWRIVGISPDDRYVVVAGEQAAQIALVDTISGKSTLVARSTEGHRSFFGGWLRSTDAGTSR